MSRKLQILLAMTLLLLVPGAARADLDAEARQRLYYQVKPATVLVWFSVEAQIYLTTDDGSVEMKAQMGGSGSGWIISSNGYLVTNGHVVEKYHEDNEEQLKAQLFFAALEENYFPQLQQQQGRELTQQEKIQILQQLLPKAQIVLLKTLDVYLQNWKKYTAEVKEYSPPMSGRPGKTSLPWENTETGKDVAILKIEARDLPTVRMGDSDRVELGTTVHVAGYPGVVMEHAYLNPQSVLEASFTRGQISSLKLDVKGSNVLQMDAPVTWGNSGGPVFSDAGEVVGMATFISLHEGKQAIQGFNFAVPVNVVREFVRAAGVDISPSAFDGVWTEALDLYYSGKKKDSMRKFDEALLVMPDLPDAVKLRREAMMAPEGGGLSTTNLIILIAIVVGAGLIIIGLLNRRKGAGGKMASGKGKGEMNLGQIIIQEGPLRGNRFPVSPSGLRIGRDPQKCQVVIDEEVVSREHAIIQASEGGELMIKSLSGTNPTQVNDRPITETTLRTGDLIKIGNSVLRYQKP